MKDEKQEKDKEIKTVEDLDKKDNVPLKELPEKTPFEEKYNQLKIDFDKLNSKYTKAIEENNRLFQRLTGTPQTTTESALDNLLKIKGEK